MIGFGRVINRVMVIPSWYAGDKDDFLNVNDDNALCGYPLVKMELEIQTRFLPRLPFSCNSIISDKIWRKMSLSLSIFLVLPQISLVKYYETIKILMQIF